jgi:cytochrome P450
MSENNEQLMSTTSDISSRFCHHIHELARARPRRNEIYSPAGPRMLIIQDLQDADRVLRHNVDNYPKDFKWFAQVAGRSRLSENGAAWQFRQNLSQPFLGKYDPARAFDISASEAEKLARHLAARPDAEILDESAIQRCMLSIFTRMFLELELSQLPVAPESASHLIELASAYAFVAPGQEAMRHDKARIAEILKLRKSIFDGLKTLRDPAAPQSPLLKKLLAAELEPGADFSFEQELSTLLGVAADTPFYSVGWALHLLAAHPALQERLHAGIGPIWTRHGGNSDEDRRALRTAIAQHGDLRGFIGELLRLHPPLPFVTRVARGRDRLSDLEVEPGDVIVISLIGVNHAALDRPDPWTPDIDAAAREGESAAGLGPGTSLISAFTWGKRVCGGRSLALVQLATVLGVLIRHLRVEVSRDEPLVYEWVGQARRQGGHRVRVAAREH